MSAIRPIMRPFRVATPFRQPSSFRQRRLTWASSPGAGSSRGLTTKPSLSSGSGSSSRRRLLYPLALLPAGLLLIPALSADSEPAAVPVPTSLSASTTSELLRTWFVYATISMPGVVDYSPAVLDFFVNSPLRSPTEWFVRHTFFGQFVAGETVEGCMPTLKALRERNVGAMLNYSAEVHDSQLNDDSPAKEERDRKEREKKFETIITALEAAGEYERSLPVDQRGVTGFALKITGLIDANILERASYTLLRLRPLAESNSPTNPNTSLFVPYPGTPENLDQQVVARTPELKLGDGKELLALKGKWDKMGVLEKDPGLQEGDLEELRQLWYKLLKIGQKAKENNIILYVDAEHTWYQPALDAYTLLLSQEFNRPPTSKGKIWTGPLIYGTYQSYLCRQPTHLIRAIQHAEANGYALGVKLVRGAYFEQERKKWSDDGRIGADPIWPSKAATDISYNGSISVIMTTLASQLKSPHPELALSVAFGTHNPESCDFICENLLKNDLAKEVGETKMLRLRQDVRGKVRIAQLLGMKDDLTDRMASKFVNDGKPVALKYMAYGKLSEVMPYLGRRAIENKSLMSGDQGAAAEMGRVAAELKRRFFGGSV
ncbi:uncharacterized protein IAS62_004244 [Cryptococcus decagattii]|uniref:Proline dehydrogenase n=1 Tax=Cryptococcus decagattii TaxID=1859122 RepID=A0ABZ2AWH1_9TREE